jgi:RHS repeat-associated protein
MTDLTYPDGRHIKQTWSAAGRLTQITDTSTNYQYLTPNSSYWPNGMPQSMWYGNGMAVGFHLNNRLQVDDIGSTRIGASAPGSYSANISLSTKHYCYGPATPPLSGSIPGCPALASANTGNIWQSQDALNSGRTQTFGYDPLNRLTSFVRSDNAMQQTYAYDSFGNMNQTTPGTLQSNLSFNANNQAIGNGYDAAGNVTSYNDGVSTKALGYDAENKLLNFNSGAATYTYDANRGRVRKDAGNFWTEYVSFNGQTLAEKSSDGTWSDYIYANGQRIARADGYDIRIHMSGTNCSNCGSNPNMYVGVTSLTAANGYTIRNGDILTWRQYQHGSTTGGLYLYFTDHSDGLAATDTDGQLILQDTTMNSWHMRTVDLSQFAGKTIQLIDPFQWTGASAGNWDIYYGDISLVSTDGSVIPIYSRSMQSLATATNPTVSNFSAITEKVADSTPLTTTTYYHGDQVGSTRLMTAGGGWPVSSDNFYPFGQEPSPISDPNHYKYATLERDSESSLDHTMFRQYSSAQGRWLSADPYSGSYDFSDPQSFNRYSYVGNMPLSFTDPSGLLRRCNGTPADTDGYCYTDSPSPGPGTNLPWYISEYGGPGCGAVSPGQAAWPCQTIIYPDKPTTAPSKPHTQCPPGTYADTSGTPDYQGGATEYGVNADGTPTRFAGRRTASGSIFDPWGYTAATIQGPKGARWTIPKNTFLNVVSANNPAANVVVQITDTGILGPGDVIDLSAAAMKTLTGKPFNSVPVKIYTCRAR